MQPLKPKRHKEFNLYGFDVETYGQKSKFYCCSIYSDDFQRTYYSKAKFKKDMKTLNRFRESTIVATNLGFDYHAVFNRKDDVNINWMRRGSDFINAKTYIKDGKFHKYRKEKNKDGKRFIKDKKYKLEFIDTYNFVMSSVEELGKVIKIKKLKTPDFIGEKPKTKTEKEYMEKYNMRDSEISYKFTKYLFSEFRKLNTEPKFTIASTAMNCFRKNYLKETYYQPETEDLIDMFKAYYGGRVEAFKRGKIENQYLYDINSLYPYVMQKEYPNPNFQRFRKHGKIDYIKQFEGISEVEVSIDKIDVPLLPLRLDKVMFPIGRFSAWYSHVELRKALELGYVITKIKKQYYFKEKCRPFFDFVNDMYAARQKYKKGTIMNLTVKLIMNSLYGKFGQKFLDKSEWQPCNHTQEQLRELKGFVIKNGYIYTKQDRKPSCFCIPIWAIYTTAYGRLELYKYLTSYDVTYCDTDSIITKNMLVSSDALGSMKLEREIKEGVIVKPKFYRLDGNAKIKGIGMKLLRKDFEQILCKKTVKYDKFVKFAESQRRNLVPNEIIEIEKELSLEDDKRIWEGEFSHESMQFSSPLTVRENVVLNSKLKKEKYLKEVKLEV